MLIWWTITSVLSRSSFYNHCGAGNPARSRLSAGSGVSTFRGKMFQAP
jgi:hypothetical protein